MKGKKKSQSISLIPEAITSYNYGVRRWKFIIEIMSVFIHIYYITNADLTEEPVPPVHPLFNRPKIESSSASFSDCFSPIHFPNHTSAWLFFLFHLVSCFLFIYVRSMFAHALSQHSRFLFFSFFFSIHMQIQASTSVVIFEIDWLNLCLSLQATPRLMATLKRRAWATCRTTRSRSIHRLLLRESVDSVCQQQYPHCIRLRALIQWLHRPTKCAAQRDNPWPIYQQAAVRPVPYRCRCPPHPSAAYMDRKTQSCKIFSSNNNLCLLLLAAVRQRRPCAHHAWVVRQVHHALSTSSSSSRRRNNRSNSLLLCMRITHYFIQKWKIWLWTNHRVTQWPMVLGRSHPRTQRRSCKLSSKLMNHLKSYMWY